MNEKLPPGCIEILPSLTYSDNFSPHRRIFTDQPVIDGVPPAGFNEKLVMSHLPTYGDDKHPDNDEVRCEQKSFSLL